MLIHRAMTYNGFYFFVIIKMFLQLGMIIGIWMICLFWRKDSKKTRRLLPRACCLFSTNQFCRLILNCFEIANDKGSPDLTHSERLTWDLIGLILNIIFVFVYMYFMGILNRYRRSRDKEEDDKHVQK